MERTSRLANKCWRGGFLDPRNVGRVNKPEDYGQKTGQVFKEPNFQTDGSVETDGSAVPVGVVKDYIDRML